MIIFEIVLLLAVTVILVVTVITAILVGEITTHKFIKILFRYCQFHA